MQRLLVAILALLLPTATAAATVWVEGDGAAVAIARPVLSFPGGTLFPPPADGWPFFAVARDTHAEVGRRYARQGAVTARAWWRDLSDGSDGPAAELRATLREVRRSYTAPEWRLRSFETSEAVLPVAGASCRTYRLEAARVRFMGAPEAEAVRVEGRGCVFPKRNLLLRWEYGERRAAATSPYGDFESEAAAFLASLRFD